jgi:ribosomal protein S18 acetylase RimI-like enzyme
MLVRAATTADHDAIWSILEPAIRAGETYRLPVDMSRADAVRYWIAPDNEVYVAEDNGRIVGTYFLCANGLGGGSHVANCGYVTAHDAFGRGVARAMCAHSLARAKVRGFKAMQFNFVVSTNERAIRLWQSFGFEIVGRLPGAFKHPTRGFVDVFVMFRTL